MNYNTKISTAVHNRRAHTCSSIYEGGNSVRKIKCVSVNKTWLHLEIWGNVPLLLISSQLERYQLAGKVLLIMSRFHSHSWEVQVRNHTLFRVIRLGSTTIGVDSFTHFSNGVLLAPFSEINTTDPYVPKQYLKRHETAKICSTLIEGEQQTSLFSLHLAIFFIMFTSKYYSVTILCFSFRQKRLIGYLALPLVLTWTTKAAFRTQGV